MRARDEVHEHERVHDGEPQRLGAVDAVVEGEPRNVDRHQGDTDQGQNAEGDGREGRCPADVVAHHRGDAARQGKEQRTVRRGGVLPHGVDTGIEPAGDGRHAVGVGVDTLEHQLALGEIRVGIPAEQRRHEQERGHPQCEHAPQSANVAHVSGQDIATDDQPRLEQECAAQDDRQPRDHDADARVTQGVDEGDVSESVGRNPSDT